MRPIVRIEEAGLGAEAHVRLVVSRVSDPSRLRATWSSSGATVEEVDGRLRATTTVEALARAAGRSLEADEAQALDANLRAAIKAWLEPPPPVTLANGMLRTDLRPLVAGVVNVTPDSFSDGGALYPDGHPGTAIEHGRTLIGEGADLLDIGGESTRPGASPVDADEELARVEPVVAELAGDAIVSIDTTKATVARAALEAGATIVNDVSGAANPELLEVTAERGAAYVLMHTRGTPADMAERASYTDVVAEVYEFLADGLARCEEAGIDPARVIVDTGIGFAKDPGHNLALLRSLRQFRGLGRPVLVGASRKSFLGAILGGADVGDRLVPSLACATHAVAAGAAVLRVHDVAATVRAARTMRAVEAGPEAWPELS